MADVNNIGIWGEDYAARLYARHGFIVLARNSYNHQGKRMGEIDLIVRKRDLLVFVEVKTRLSAKYGLPEEAVNFSKRQKIIRSVNWFLHSFPDYAKFRVRIDVCAIMLNPPAGIGPHINLDKFVKYGKIITNAVELN